MGELTDGLWERFGSLAVDDLPEDVATVAQQSILDWFGCALAGSREPLSVILRDELTSALGDCSIVGSGRRADAMRAAMVNGAAGHALDFDDTAPVMGGHPTVPILPAVLAVAEVEALSGAEVLAAYVAGVEVASRIGASIGREHYANGWHQTATMGVFGAAAAVSRLHGLDAEAFGHAMGLAASGAAGVKANFGTMAKPLHPGMAAERGILAARLAARGFTANADAIDGNQGYAQAAGSGALDADALGRWDGRWATTRTLFKFHAACHLTHAGIEATRSMLARGVSASDVESITLTVNPSILDVCGIPDPTTGLEAKFSLRGTQALLVNGVDTAAVATYEDGPINRPEVQASISMVSIETDESFPVMRTRSVVRVGGAEHEADVDVGEPATDLVAQGDQLRAKFLALATPAVGPDRADTLMAALIDVASLADVGELLRNTSP